MFLYADERDKIKKTLSPIFEANETDIQKERRSNIDTGYSLPSPKIKIGLFDAFDASDGSMGRND